MSGSAHTTGATTNTPPMAADDRARRIAEALQQASAREHYVPTEDGYLAVPVATVVPEALVYRADNGRILSELAHAAHARGTPLRELKAHAETAWVQGLLHELLIDKARDPDGPIYDELARYARQTEPLLVTRDGVVVNGNRRLAAMQALRRDDPETYGGFAEVRAAVLPDDVGRDRLEYIEAALQMAPELKLSYSWINRRLKLREHARDLDPTQVAKAYRFADSGEIDRELAELGLAEAYLRWTGASGEYARVADQEARFQALNEQLGNLKAGHMQTLWQQIGFAMLHARDALDRKLDHYYPFTPPKPGQIVHWVPRTLAEERDLVARQEPGQVRRVHPDLAERLRTQIDAPARAETTARAVMGLIDTLKSNQDTYLGPDRVVHHLRQAREAFEAIDTERLADRQKRRIQAELAALQQHGTALETGDDGRRPMPRQQEKRLPGALRLLVRQARRLRRGTSTG